MPFGKRAFVVLAGVALGALLLVVAMRPSRSPAAPLPAPVRPEASAVAPARVRPSPFSVDLRTLPAADELPAGTLRVLTLGDSVSRWLGLALRYRQEEENAFVADRGVGSCSILESRTVTQLRSGPRTEEEGCAARWVDDVNELEPDVTLLVLGGAFFSSMIIEGKEQHACDAGWRAIYRARLESLIDAMRPSAGRVVLTLAPYPMDRWRYGKVLERVDCFNALLSEVARTKALATVDLAAHICPTRDCIRLSQGHPIRPDGLHPDGVGAEESARWTLKELRRIAAAPCAP